MALDPLTIATQGLLSTPELIAVQGLLEGVTPDTGDKFRIGSPGVYQFFSIQGISTLVEWRLRKKTEP